MASQRRVSNLKAIVINMMPRDLYIVDNKGGCVSFFSSTPGHAAQLMCSSECQMELGDEFLSKCARVHDITENIYSGDGREYEAVSLRKIGSVNDRIPLYHLRGERPKVLDELENCLHGKYVSVNNLPDTKTMQKRSIVRCYYVVSYGVALMVNKAGDSLDYLLVPVKPYLQGGQLEGFRGLMPAKCLLKKPSEGTKGVDEVDS